MYREIITVNCNNISEHTNTVLAQNAESFNVTYGNQQATEFETCVIHSLGNSNKFCYFNRNPF
jgi:hypothetical protein